MKCRMHSRLRKTNSKSMYKKLTVVDWRSRKEEAFKRRENELREKDLKIQESLIKFSKYLQENELKRKKAEDRKLNEIKVSKTIKLTP